MMTLILQQSALTELGDRVSMMASGFQSGALDFLLAIAIAVVAWAMALIVSGLLRRILGWARVGQRMQGWSGGRPGADAGALIAWAVRWLILASGLILACDVLGFDLSASLTDRLREVLPRVLAATLLLVLGVTAAMLLGTVTERFFGSAGLTGARLRGQIVTGLLTLFAVLLALEQLGFAAQFAMGIGLILIGAAGLAAGLAFGLGCRDLARDFVVEYLKSLDEEQSPPRT
jgi:hypothetical protein